jgi:hypothetical protein
VFKYNNISTMIPKLTDGQIAILKGIIRADIVDLAQSPEFFDQMNYEPKAYIDDRIALTEQFGLDFWKEIELFCSHVEFERLKALYNGSTLRQFYETYQAPSEPALAKAFLRALIERINH